jgi:Bacterial Ig-like domain (group 3)/FG-GAP-like repeat/FG-GAP repeat
MTRTPHVFRVVSLFVAPAMLGALVAIAEHTGTRKTSSALSAHEGSRDAARAAVQPWKERLGVGSIAPDKFLFLPPVSYGSGGVNAWSVAVADVNQDGKPDLLVANENDGTVGTVGVLLGNGDGTFQPAVTYNSGGLSAFSVAVMDVNQDGKPDLLVANSSSNTIGVLLGNGDGTFRRAVTYSSGGLYAMSVAVSDVNGDGKPDLLVANLCGNNGTCESNGTVGVLLGNGDGTFQAAVTYDSGGTFVVAVAVADVNGDGKPDLVVGHHNSGTVGVLLGNGDGTFQPPVIYGSGATYVTSVAVADVNGDGKPDLLVANHCRSKNCTKAGVSVLLGNGDGSFQPAVIYRSGGGYASSVAVADVNGDGKPDLLVTNQCAGYNCFNEGTVGVLLGNGDGTFRPAMTYSSGGWETYANGPTSVAVTDVNGDGRPDLLVANQCASQSCVGGGSVGVLLGNGLSNTPRQTSTSLSPSLNPSIYGQAVTFTATVESSGSITPSGTVKFIWSGHYIGSATLNGSGVAILTKSKLNADPYPLTAVYVGDALNLGSTSPVLNQVVLETTSTATLTSSPNPSTQGQTVTFIAKITSPTMTPTGPVTFTAGKTLLGTAQLGGGKATLNVSSLPWGSTTVTATYSGDSNIAKSSASDIQVVQP